MAHIEVRTGLYTQPTGFPDVLNVEIRDNHTAIVRVPGRRWVLGVRPEPVFGHLNSPALRVVDVWSIDDVPNPDHVYDGVRQALEELRIHFPKD